MNRKQLEEYFQKLLEETPEIINAIYESLDDADIDTTREILRERTGCDMTDMFNREDALLAVIIIKTLSGIRFTEEEQMALNTALALREDRIKEGDWHPSFRWNGNGFSTDGAEDYLY